MNWFYWLTGGRPMHFEQFAFIDKVSHRRVNYYIDGLGQRWLAESRWAWFRIKAVTVIGDDEGYGYTIGKKRL